MGTEGEEAHGVYDALTFLRQAAGGEITEGPGRVLVIGGGNAAVDSARTALRLGAASVTVLYRRTRDEMPASREEVEDALLEGVDIRYLVAPTGIDADGRVRGVRCVEMELGEADEGGRRRPVPKPGYEVVFDADLVIVAVGQGPELGFVSSDRRVVVARGRIVADPLTQRTGDGPVFAGGDAVTGPATLIEAIAAGQRAAQAIDVLLGGRGELPLDHGFASRSKPAESEAAAPRVAIASLSEAERRGNFREVMMAYSAEQACAEARRCLRCDLEE